MKGKSIFLWGGLAALAFVAYRSTSVKATLKFLQWSINGIKFNLRNILKPEITFSVELFNPNQDSIAVDSVFGTIKCSGMLMANFKNAAPVNITGKERQTVQVTATINALNLILRIIRGENVGRMDIEGLIKTPYFTIPVQKSINAMDAISGVNPMGKFNRNPWKLLRDKKRQAAANGKLLRDKYMQARKAGLFTGGFLQYVRSNKNLLVPAAASSKI